MNTPFTPEERRDLLDRYFPAFLRWQDLNFELSVSRSSGGDPRLAESEHLMRVLTGLRDQYRSSLPVLPVSRSPFSHQVLYHSLDPIGIDGLWWNYDVPVRPVEYYPPDFHTLSGSLSLDAPLENAPFLCVPGPGAPFVVPEILADGHIRAVLSRVVIGRHTGFVTAYYTDDPTVKLPRMNGWGMGHWEHLDRRGTFTWGESSVKTPAGFDFDLAPWIEKEKLFWISPGDTSFALQRGVKTCPYLGVSGTKTMQRIRKGLLLTTVKMEGE